MKMSTDFSEQLLEQTSDAVIAISLDGKALHWNHGAEVIFDLTRDEAAGRLLTELIVPSDRR